MTEAKPEPEKPVIYGSGISEEEIKKIIEVYK